MIFTAIINIGRLHPLFIHLPIGILYFAFALYVYQLWKKEEKFNDAIRWGVGFASLCALASVGTGLLLSNEGGYETEALNWHKYMGIGMTFLSLILFWALSPNSNGGKKILTPIFVILIAALTATGHFGGNLTHGEDFLFTSPEDDEVVIEDIQKAKVYDDIVHPMLKSKCVSCHNPSKLKGELLMTTYENLMKGGENGVIISLEDPESSELIRRIHLPMNDKKHMPPKGKRQLDDDDLDLLQWWIDNKACPTCVVSELTQDEKIQNILATYGQSTVDPRLASLSPVGNAALTKLYEKGFNVNQVAEDNPFVYVRLKNNFDLERNSLSDLSSIKNNILEIDLSNSNLTNEMTKTLASFENVERIQLQKTGIGDNALDNLGELEHLKSLNLFSTNVTDEGLSQISEIPQLERLYLWQSQVTDEGVKAFNEKNPTIEVNYKIENAMFSSSNLSAPEIRVGNDIFFDSVVVSIFGTFEGTQIYYTLDGGDPDSTSILYENPIVLTESTEIRAFARKQEWLDSPISSKLVVSTGYKIQGITLVVPADKKYKGKGGSTLIDLEKGGEDFNDGKWLGFQAQHLEAVMELSEEEEIQSLYVSALSAPGSWIFFPRGISVSISTDGKNYKKAGGASYELKQSAGKEFKSYDISFQPSKAKFIKLKVESILKNPSWHPNPGGKSWLFVDEIFVN